MNDVVRATIEGELAMISFEDDRRTRAEQKLLGALLLDAGALRHCEGLKPADFSHELHGSIFAAIQLLLALDYAVNASSVCEFVRIRHQALRFDVFPYLLTLLRLGGVPAHAGYYAAMMLDQSQHHECDFRQGSAMCFGCGLLVRDSRGQA